MKETGIGPLVLCVDSDEKSLHELIQTLESNGFAGIPANNPGLALELIVRRAPSIVITEIDLPEMDALSYLRALRRQNEDAVIIVRTNWPERRQGADRRLGMVFEYLVKPVGTEELMGTVRRAWDFFQEKLSYFHMAGESEGRMRNQLEWLLWKEHQKLSHRIAFGHSMIDSIRHFVNQGRGVGGLLTSVDMMQLHARPAENGNVTIPATVLDSIYTNADSVRIWLDGLESVIQAFRKTYEPQVIPVDELFEIIRQAIHDVEKLRKIKGQRINTGKFISLPSLRFNKEALALTLRELLTNAFKYSPDETRINLGLHRSGNSVSLLIVNDIQEYRGGITGMPEESQQEVFEPFFRLNNAFDDRFQEEEFGMGVGLTVVQGAMNKLGGKVYVYEVVDHVTEEQPKKRVVAEVVIPVYQG